MDQNWAFCVRSMKLFVEFTSEPLVDAYFTRLPLNEVTSKHEKDELILAHNGWIWNADPLLNFASKESKSYLRRELIAWADCVKLRYGETPVRYRFIIQRKIVHGFGNINQSIRC